MTIFSTPNRRLVLRESSSGAVVPLASNGDLIELDVSQLSRVAIEIANTGANAFDAFLVLAKVSDSGAWLTLLSASTDYTSPAGIVVDASGDLTALAAGATGWVILDVLGLTKIKLQASAAVGASTASVVIGGA